MMECFSSVIYLSLGGGAGWDLTGAALTGLDLVCRPGWLQTNEDSSAFASQILGLKAWTSKFNMLFSLRRKDRAPMVGL